MTAKRDHWSSQAYASSASFVPVLTTKVQALLSPQPGDAILDIGCGDGLLTSTLSAAVGSTGRVLAIDASPSMISSAQTNHSSANTTYRVLDGTRLDSDAEVVSGAWDKVFSNAALHWILKPEATRRKVFADCFAALRRDGRLVFEMGAAGNVAEVHAAVIAALIAHGASAEEARAAVPWFFPSETRMRGVLMDVGFDVEVVETEYRPTRLNPENEEGTGGLEGWVRLMCASLLEVVEPGKRDAVVSMVREILTDVVTREEDESQWIGYVRLRAVARKP